MDGFSVPRIHPAGWPFIGGFIAVAILLALFSDVLGVVGAIAAAWCIFFFRDTGLLGFAFRLCLRRCFDKG